MWNEKRSLALSKLCTLLAMAALALTLCGAPWLVPYVMAASSRAAEASPVCFYLTLYSGGALAAGLLWWLYSLLHNISQDAVFTHRNISLLRRISWCCFAGAAVCLLSFFYYNTWGVVGLAAAFVGLIVRVVKNVFAKALRLKEENDYTI